MISAEWRHRLAERSRPATKMFANRAAGPQYVRYGRKEVVQLNDKRQTTPEVTGC
jgi:hypothetical protein